MKKFLPTSILVLYAFFATQAFMACQDKKINHKNLIEASYLMHLSLRELSEIQL